MKKFVSLLQTLRVTTFSVAIIFCALSLNGSRIYATTINSEQATAIKLTQATLGATITPSNAVVTERGIVWSTTSGVTMADHVLPEGGITGGTYSVVVAGLDRSATIYFKGYYTDLSGTYLSDELSFTNVPVFSGNGNWNVPSNWSVQEVPGLASGDSPIIDGNCTIATNSINGNWTCSNLTINAGAVLTINTSCGLKVNGVLINKATASGLVIKADADNPNGTLTFVNGNPLATVEMYSKASWDLNQAVGSRYSWQFFGIPVKTVLITDAFTNCFVRQYDETSVNDAGLWTDQSPNVSLTSGTGYEIVQHAPKIYQIQGELTNQDFNKTLDYTTGANFPGQHIFANPYTAAVDIKAVQFGPNTEQSIYLYNTGTYNQWLDNVKNESNGTTAAPGQYIVTTPQTVGTLGVPTQIPSMQGFLMKTTNLTSGSVTIPYASATMNNTEQQRAPGKNKMITSGKVATRIDLSGSHYADCMWIFTDPGCTTKFDNGWDGYKMMGSLQSPQLYAMEPDGNYQIDAVSDISGTVIGFNAGQDTDYKLTFTHQNTDTRYSALYLIDATENKTIDITASGSEYAFTATSTPGTTSRFKIITDTDANTGIPQVTSSVKIINSNGTLVINNLTDQNGDLTLYTMNGLAVKKIEFKTNSITSFSTANLLPGAYVAKAQTNLVTVTEKIIIR